MAKFWTVLVVLVILAWWWRGRTGAKRAADLNRSAPSHPLGKPQNMVACAHCGLHLPAKDAVFHQGHAFCSLDHAKQGVVAEGTRASQDERES